MTNTPATKVGEDPLDLVTRYEEYTADPGEFDYALFGDGKAGDAYERYLEQRKVLDRAFWEEVRGLSETNKASISMEMRKMPGYVEMKAIHVANQLERGQ